ncbi:hypothetical protein [Mycolicibacterium neworleansense]|uniref:Uncharacterized protein n=1 Tax=Mycolicibacterium neworleansense TaxID=146018 RepID=A0A0H5RV15_9MYCO|nr:hypothetical protein [Mycolicibacterium neworleansense]MCV7365480.1 hypothetical protein [Mycolicibacterium neworleansense]CRZ17980.1 hypothetical protein BN2156_04877 [Mycolicibacterium neworleansense]
MAEIQPVPGGIGYRYWELHDDGTLSSPIAGDILAPDGQLVATCDRDHQPPSPPCLCGIAYYRSADDLHRALVALDRDPFDYVTTTGTLTGPVTPDHKAQHYYVGGWPVICPDAMRCRAYQVDTIITADYFAANRIRLAYPSIRVNHLPLTKA